MKMTRLCASSFYKFFPVPGEKLPALRKALQEGGEGRVKGLLILAEEGINGSFCARPSDAEAYKYLIESLFQKQRGDFFYKDSFCSEWSFRRLSVKVKREIVTMNRPFPFQTENSPGKFAVPPSSADADKASRAEKNFGKKFLAEKASCEAVTDDLMSDDSKKSPPSVPAKSSSGKVLHCRSATGRASAMRSAEIRSAEIRSVARRASETLSAAAADADKAAAAKFCGENPAAPALTPEEWDKKLQKGASQILDVRNSYETETGKFKGALSMNIQHFKTFPDKLKEALSKGFEGGAKLDPKKETLIYCTGGIRCEKAALAMPDFDT